MAKSIRSKQKRRMRAIKRVRYGQKELKRLVDMVKKAEENKKNETIDNIQPNMDIDKPAGDFISIKPMETDQTERNSKTMLNKFGQYPEWMNGRRLKKQKTIVKRLKKKNRRKV